jgi:hypothetical protein
VPLYFFNVFNDEVTLDPEGAELPDLEAARQYAVRAVRSLAADTVMQGHLTGHHHIEIVDESHNRLATVRFDEAIDIKP